jgi:hypothetical protein
MKEGRKEARKNDEGKGKKNVRPNAQWCGDVVANDGRAGEGTGKLRELGMWKGISKRSCRSVELFNNG